MERHQFSETNQLIFNMKKPLDRRCKPDWIYKNRTVERAGRLLREALDGLNSNWLSAATLVPMPPSKVRTDPMYDGRLVQMVGTLGAGLSLDVRELVIQRASTEAAHSSEDRRRVEELCDNYFIDEALVDPAPRVIGVVDDVLTTGAHFKAAQRVLRSRFPSVRIYGIFVARRVPDSGDV